MDPPNLHPVALPWKVDIYFCSNFIGYIADYKLHRTYGVLKSSTLSMADVDICNYWNMQPLEA